MIERVNRRFASLLRTEMAKLGIEDVGPAQAMVLMAIGDVELSVGRIVGPGALCRLQHFLLSEAACRWGIHRQGCISA